MLGSRELIAIFESVFVYLGLFAESRLFYPPINTPKKHIEGILPTFKLGPHIVT
jgi:hypothetical protein